MMYQSIKERLLDLLKAPRQPPDPPAGSQGSVEIFQAAPNFLRYQVIGWGAGFAGAMALSIGMIVSGHFDGDSAAAALLGYLLLLLSVVGTIVKYFLIRLEYDMRYYVVTDRSLRIREGAIIIHESTYTFANVQNVRIHQGPVERLLGLENLVVETAGGGGGSSGDKHQHGAFGRSHEGKLRGITNARAVRDQMLRLMKRYRDAGLGDPEDRGRAAPAGRVAGLPAAAIERLKEIRAELKGLGEVMGT